MRNAPVERDEVGTEERASAALSVANCSPAVRNFTEMKEIKTNIVYPLHPCNLFFIFVAFVSLWLKTLSVFHALQEFDPVSEWIAKFEALIAGNFHAV
jgi:hypothetical protein